MSGEHDAELRKEASVMALYVAVCLLAALIALGEDADQGHVRTFGIVWGTTTGLALARLHGEMGRPGSVRSSTAV